ncbi:chitin-binding protein [Micromonospora kangleipakensis]|uniref:Chitin-binding protein n=1 Tax=Micromonospora kangleipakensis TaxID=1077942 RepID=A0A4Q8BIN1_9ACTN|nr:lytic polysaccharide monooxygenase [Micromonospora kangleipakensis]RZU77253.1 chitin-binding protein [Micromonospora kangleipakensis]
MNRRRRALTVAAIGGIPILACLALVSQAGAHGSMQSPVSRTYACFLEGPESPDTDACRAAVAAGGTQALYDWNEVNIADAAGRHRQLIPDGHLCSANRDKYRGFDLARADWPATALPSGDTWTFAYRATAPHRGTFELYVTRDGYDPTRPLRWADLELFHTATDPALTDGAYRMTARLPHRAGRHLVYSIWQRSDSPEAFYTCSDVTFGQVTPTTAPPTTTPPPTTSPSPTTPPPTTTAPPSGTPTAGAPAWQPNTPYALGALVSYAGRTWQCRQAHTSLTGWEPPNVPALWLAA